MIHFRKRGKLGPRYILPIRVIAKVGKVAYRLDLPSELSQIHKNFPCLSVAEVCVGQQGSGSMDGI